MKALTCALVSLSMLGSSVVLAQPASQDRGSQERPQQNTSQNPGRGQNNNGNSQNQRPEANRPGNGQQPGQQSSRPQNQNQDRPQSQQRPNQSPGRDDNRGPASNQRPQAGHPGNGQQPSRPQSQGHDRPQQQRPNQPQSQRHDNQPNRPAAHFRQGEPLPHQYRSHQVDWRAHGLRQPPQDHHWVRVGNDFVLIAMATGVITSILLNN